MMPSNQIMGSANLRPKFTHGILLKIAGFLLLWQMSCTSETGTARIPARKEKATLLGIQPYEKFPAALMDTLIATIGEIYGFDAVVLPAIPLPKAAFIQVKSARYRADSLIRFQRAARPDSVDFVIGLTTSDISTTKRDASGAVKKPEYKYQDWGIFGLGYCPGSSCIVSTFRYKTGDTKLFHSRFKKICIHELGHNLGLPHCDSGEPCVMKDAAETIKTIDSVELELCKKCWNKLR